MGGLDKSVIAGIPKADLHMHAETRARLDRLVSRRNNGTAHDWAEEVRRLAHLRPIFYKKSRLQMTREAVPIWIYRGTKH